MFRHRFPRAKGLAWLPTLGGVLVLAALSGASRGQTPAQGDTQKQISEIQKQIDELTRKLAEIKKASEAAPAPNAGPDTLTPGPDWLKPLAWRALGPANMGGRITALAVYEADPSTFWVATAGGGLLKTLNNGITFEHQFDREGTVSIGDVAVAPADKNVVWVGTGESNPRNSVSYGDGVYKSTDGGKTWKNMGLRGAFHIGKVVIHPKDPNVVYVGVLGRLYGPSDERGLYKTTDGGATWNRVLFVDDRTGVIDVRMSPADPETLFVATYERLRDLYDVGDPVKKFGAGSAIYRTTDGGKSFTKLTKGLPTVKLGRIGLDLYRKDPKTVYAVVESEKIGTGPRPRSASAATSQAYLGVVGGGEDEPANVTQVSPGGPAEKAGLKVGDKVKAVDGKDIKVYSELVNLLREKKVGDKVELTVEREGKPTKLTATLEPRPAGQGAGGRGGPPTGQGREPGSGSEGESGEGIAQLGLNPSERPFGAALGGQIENAQERQGPDGFQTGGVYKSTDGGDTWTRINSLNPRPFYFSQVRVDPSDNKYLFILGLALHKSEDSGKTFRADASRGVHADHHALWVDPRDGRHLILAGDGGAYVSYDRGASWDHLNHAAIGQFYHVAIEPRRPYRVYGGLQDNGSWGGPSMSRSGEGTVNEDWISVGGGDGFHCAVDQTDPDIVYSMSQYGVLSRRNLRTGEVAPIRPVPEKGKVHRFNWNTPIILSSHNSKIYYTAGEVVFRSLDRGNDLRPISPDVTRTKAGSSTALAESPKNPEVLWVGTDDGHLWVTRNGGKDWENVTRNVGLDRPCYVSTIEASRAEEGRAYVSFDGHRSDTDEPLVYVTEDFGKTWKTLRANLPRGSSRCLREDLFNPNLLYLGTEFAVWASFDRGLSWVKINGNLPTVAVHEIAIHPTCGEIVAATHGRSLWALDVSGLRQITRDVVKAKATLLKPTPAVRWQQEPIRGTTNRKFTGQNPPRGAQIDVAIGGKVEKARIKILDFNGDPVLDTTVSTTPGLHRISWPLTRPTPPRAGGARGPGGGGGGGAGGMGGFLARRGFGPPAAAGNYKVVLTVDGQEFTQPLKVENDPAYPAPPEISAEAFEEDADMDAEEEEREAAARPIDVR
ncbi:MAG: PDZ domain-containing protein [Isosphaeraceae bacterium]